MEYILLTIFLGMIPEVLYFYLFLIYTKKINYKKKMLFFGIMFLYIICLLIIKYQPIYYISFIILVYILLKMLYKEKTQIIDIFVFSISTIYLTLIGFICSRFVNNIYTMYFIMLTINRILLFLPFIFRKNSKTK